MPRVFINCIRVFYYRNHIGLWLEVPTSAAREKILRKKSSLTVGVLKKRFGVYGVAERNCLLRMQQNAPDLSAQLR